MSLYIFKFNSNLCVVIDSVSGQKVYSRHCVAEAENAERNACLVRSVFPQVKILACETCQEDGCNEFFSEKLGEIKVEDANNAGIRTTSIQLLSIFGVAFLLF